MTITLTREEAQQVLDVIERNIVGVPRRQASDLLLARLAQPEPEPVVRTDQQIVDQTEELAVWLLYWCFNHQPETATPMRESSHPFAVRCWVAACHIQEMLTATDPENSVAELVADTAPVQREWQGLMDANIADAYKDGTRFVLTHRNDVLQHLNRQDNIDFARAIEAKLKEKNT